MDRQEGNVGGKRDEFSTERIEAGQVVEVARTSWTFRYRDNVKATERIYYNGEAYYVLGIVELGQGGAPRTD